MKQTKKKAPKLKFGDPIMVEWKDITGNEGWISLHQPLLEPVKIKQIGFFVSKTNKVLHITQGIPETECEVMSISAIPVGTILSMKKVKA